jgi:hypothetical protein
MTDFIAANPQSRSSSTATRPACSAMCRRSGCARPPTTRGWCESHYRRQIRMGLAGYVDAGPTREHLDRLRALGWTYQQIGAAAGISLSTAFDLDRNRYRRLLKSSADALLRVPLEPRESHRGVLAVGTLRRVQALAWMGWPERHIAARCNAAPKTIATEVSRGRLSHRLAQRVAAVYAELSHVPGPSPAAARKARQLGHAPPLAWDDDTIDDPAARPKGTRRTA